MFKITIFVICSLFTIFTPHIYHMLYIPHTTLVSSNRARTLCTNTTFYFKNRSLAIVHSDLVGSRHGRGFSPGANWSSEIKLVSMLSKCRFSRYDSIRLSISRNDFSLWDQIFFSQLTHRTQGIKELYLRCGAYCKTQIFFKLSVEAIFPTMRPSLRVHF